MSIKAVRFAAFVAVLIAGGVGFAISGNSGGETRTMTFVVEPAYPYAGPSLANTGYLVDIAAAALAKTGYDVKVDFKSHDEAMERTQEGDYDAVLGAHRPGSDTMQLQTSEDLASAGLVCLARQGARAGPDSLMQMDSNRVGVIRDSAAEGWNALNLRPDVVYIASVTEAVDALLLNRVDLIVAPGDVARAIVKNTRPEASDMVTVVGPPLDTKKMVALFSRNTDDWEIKLRDFNRGLAMIREDGTYDTITQKHFGTVL